MTKYRLKVASVANFTYSVLPKVAAVTAILEHWGYDYEPVVDPLWHGWSSKLNGFIDLARRLAMHEEYTHLMFIDASDVVLLAEPDEVMERYFAFDHPWVYNAEPFIWSPDSFQPEDYPTPQCTYRYLNAGASIGEIDHLRHWFDKWPEPENLPRGDQDWVAARFIEGYPDAIKLDHDCELFQCCCGSLTEDNPHCTILPGKVLNTTTGTEPLIIHFNGGDDITEMPSRRLLWECLV